MGGGEMVLKRVAAHGRGHHGAPGSLTWAPEARLVRPVGRVA
jgi:hypothetical protein